MEDQRKNHTKWLMVGFILILIISGSAIVLTNNRTNTGKSSQPSQDPQIGIQAWINAMNARDYASLYALSPDLVRAGIDEPGFARAQDGNPLFAKGSRITDFQVLNQSSNGYNVTIDAMVVMMFPDEVNSSVQRNIPIKIKFIETYEHGSLKVWAA